jgi:hypothetical protein
MTESGLGLPVEAPAKICANDEERVMQTVPEMLRIGPHLQTSAGERLTLRDLVADCFHAPRCD